MNYKVIVSEPALNQIIQIKNQSYSNHIVHYIFSELKDLKTLPDRFDTVSNRYDIPVSKSIRVIPLKNYVGIYHIEDKKVIILTIINQYMDIRKILRKMNL